MTTKLEKMRSAAAAIGRRLCCPIFRGRVSGAMLGFAVTFTLLHSSETVLVNPGSVSQMEKKERALATMEERLRARDNSLQAMIDELAELDLSGPAVKAKRGRLGLGGGRDTGEIVALSRRDRESQATELRRRLDEFKAVGQEGRARLSLPVRDLTTSRDEEFVVERLRSLPLGIPVVGDLSSTFGYRRSPFSGGSQFHAGLDISVDHGSDVFATADGIVIEAGFKGSYGRRVVVDHGNGIRTVFAHLSRIDVKEGRRVCRGQRLGLVGSSGSSTGPHLHYEVRLNNVPRNPAHFVEMASIIRRAVSRGVLG